MARDYGKVTHRFWTGDTGKQIRSLGLEARVVATYLLTCSSSNMIGLYYLPLALVSHETGVPLEGASKALASLSEANFAYYDDDAELVFVPQMARVQIGDELKANDKQRAGVIAQLKEHKNHRFVADFVAIYKEAYSLPDGLAAKPLASPLQAPSKPESRDQGSESIEQGTVSLPARDPSGTTTEHGQDSLTVSTVSGLIHCMRVAIEKAQPENGMWNPGGPFAQREAEGFLSGFGGSKPVSEIRRRIGLFASDASMAPWTVKKFVSEYNRIGIAKPPREPYYPHGRPTTIDEIPDMPIIARKKS